ncbi:MAG: hypothetical protein NZM26_04445 [Patescibacteria group bacterium]|nr:hypothetical protein [Patescibacteria group bacterium]
MSITHEIEQPVPSVGKQEQIGISEVEVVQPVGTQSQVASPAKQPDQNAPNQQSQPASAPNVANAPNITVPFSQSALANAAHGDASNSMTWLAHFWERVIKKALKKGWHIIFGTSSDSSSAQFKNQTTQTSQ